jgi:NADH-quinone oxidoreductase subunit L
MPHGRTELFLVGTAVLIGALGLVAGWRVTLRRRTLPAAEAPADTGLARVVYRKYYVDELYDALIVRPVVWLSRFVLWKGVDQGVVDGAAVNGTAKLSRGLGWVGSRLQTGQVGVYVVLFLVGALWVLHAVVR